MKHGVAHVADLESGVVREVHIPVLGCEAMQALPLVLICVGRIDRPCGQSCARWRTAVGAVVGSTAMMIGSDSCEMSTVAP
jgi:hypothetical protein